MKKFIIGIITVLLLTTGMAFAKNPHHHDYKGHPGYRSQPYHRDYRYNHHYYDYNYRGHWRSWNEWESYYHRHPHFQRYGRYHRIDNQLFFMFNDGFNMFMFSIGR
jgi:hypothetical protein